MLERWPHVCCVKTFVYITTDESFRFHNDEFDAMPCKLESIENMRSLEKYPTPHYKTDFDCGVDYIIREHVAPLFGLLIPRSAV